MNTIAINFKLFTLCKTEESIQINSWYKVNTNVTFKQKKNTQKIINHSKIIKANVDDVIWKNKWTVKLKKATVRTKQQHVDSRTLNGKADIWCVTFFVSHKNFCLCRINQSSNNFSGS